MFARMPTSSATFTLENSPASVSHRIRTLTVLSSGHFLVDLCQGVLPLTLPFLLTKLQLDYTHAEWLVTTAYVTSSVTQPLFGLVRHARIREATLWLGTPLACAGLAAIPLASSYAMLVTLVVIGSAGTAMYHPFAAARAHASGRRPGERSMALFVMCGNVGFTTGTMIFGPLLARQGLGAVAWLLVPALLFPGLLAAIRHNSDGAIAHRRTNRPALGEVARRMSWPVTVVALRQCAMAGLIALVPLYFTVHLRQPASLGGWMVFSLQLGSNVGMFAYGPAVARCPRHHLIVGGLVLAAPVILAFPFSHGLASAGLLFATGLLLAWPMLGLTTLGQELLPEDRALAASLILGVGIGVGGMGSALLGHVADRVNITTALGCAALLPLLAAAVSGVLPKPPATRR